MASAINAEIAEARIRPSFVALEEYSADIMAIVSNPIELKKLFHILYFTGLMPETTG